MSQDQQFLSPQEQNTLFQKLQAAGMLSQDQGQPTSTPDSDAQNGVGNVDLNTLQSLIKHAVNPQAVPMQEGDNMHPMDAIAQIGQKMFGPQAPAGVSNATGPQMSTGSNGQLYAKMPMTGLIPRLVGATQNLPITEPNYFAAAQQAGIDKFLPKGLAQMPDGTPFVGADAFSKALIAQRTMSGQGNPTYTSKDQLVSQGIPEDTANALMAANPNGVTNKELTNYLGSERIKTSQTLADARATMAGVAKLGQALKVGGFDAAQPMAEQANKNLLLVQKAQALVDQITSNGGQANIRQQAELGRNLAALVATNNGVVTDEGMNSMIPNTAMKKYGGWKEYFTNEQEPVNFGGFLPQMQDLLTREKQANLGISAAASQLGLNIMGATGQPNTATAISGARNNTPIMGNGAPSTSTTAPNPQPTGTWRVIR